MVNDKVNSAVYNKDRHILVKGLHNPLDSSHLMERYQFIKGFVKEARI